MITQSFTEAFIFPPPENPTEETHHMGQTLAQGMNLYFVVSILTISVADLPEIHKRELPCRAASILNYYNLDTLQFSTGW